MLPNCNGLGIEAGPFALPEGGHYAMEVRNMSRGNGELRCILATDRDRVRLIDVRSREESSTGTIPGALNIPVSELENALLMEPSDFQATYFAEKPKPEEENLVFFCQIGSDDCHVMQTARELEYLGANYEDAYRAWQAKED
ncbi:thiosulfate:glutathione sulfurtransferase isoform X2 [Monodelphis domestica]|uniref:thiosulfate:glutathione sulfurtransferase isoform X2 n=1 Tax=Monodelphis domestica TaxID=13616 RepID=UPI000443657D|nr:thiosulfate:glutathione sulfurtransferase isoform X2 [Monodelphis domestica]